MNTINTQLYSNDINNFSIEIDKIKSLNSTNRIDYCLQEGILDVSYITSITVHLNYWSDSDIAYFILKEIYGNIYNN